MDVRISDATKHLYLHHSCDGEIFKFLHCLCLDRSDGRSILLLLKTLDPRIIRYRILVQT